MDTGTRRHIKIGGKQLNKHKLKALILMVGAIFMAFLMVNATSQASTIRDQGPDTNGLNIFPSEGFLSITVNESLGSE